MVRFEIVRNQKEAVKIYVQELRLLDKRSFRRLMEGEFPAKAKAMVKEFILEYQWELEEMWETEKYAKLPPLNWYVS